MEENIRDIKLWLSEDDLGVIITGLTYFQDKLGQMAMNNPNSNEEELKEIYDKASDIIGYLESYV